MNEVISDVLGLASLEPTAATNHAFSRLVEEVVKRGLLPPNYPMDICQAVQHQCALGEAQLERHWTERIAAAADPAVALADFPYRDNYRELVRREVAVLASSGLELDESSRVAIVGSGPLPLTGWYLAAQTGAMVDNIDNCQQASTAGQRLAEALGWQRSGHYCADGADITLPPELYDVVYVAGLAGEDVAAKQRIIDNMSAALRPRGRFVVRGAWGARQLLYPGFDPQAFTGLQLLATYHPTDEVINSVFVYSKEERV